MCSHKEEECTINVADQGYLFFLSHGASMAWVDGARFSDMIYHSLLSCIKKYHNLDLSIVCKIYQFGPLKN